MSSIGKIFVVGNLVLSLLVLGAAGALLKNTEVTKAQVTDLEGQVASAEEALAEANSAYTERERVLNLDKQRLQEDKDDLEVARQNADRNVSRLEADNQQLRDDVTKINDKLTTLESGFSSTLQRNQELTDLNATLRAESMDAKEAQRQAELGQRESADQLAAAERQASELQAELGAATAKANDAAKLLEVAIASGFDPTSVVAMPRIEANVADVDEQYGFVVLDKGANDQVEKGFTFEIHRGGDYLGRVKVDQVYANYATASIQILADNVRMQRFDRASTYLQ
ncbi:MAG: hypothetical protein ACYTG2_16540 [Planctomycetota bacterium]|jgi:hypothetical protein